MTQRQVTMIIHMTAPMSGGRIDDRPWPPPFTDFEVAEWEGRHLIASGVAVEVADRTPPSQQPGFGQGASDPQPGQDQGQQEGQEPPANPVPPDQSPVSEGQDLGQRGDPEPDLPAQPPQPADPKQAWVDYAISKGTPPDMANAWTKQRLMAEFGGRL